ncbi:MAG: hypothetical protein CVV64_10845 [Candidatus Wallbacteria bacterium HGW-Wallbacteria-1]|jgi:prepilin-type N-terminal cleavage/methylation domain-containing protein|uniref:Uncharacterized protein n=1 Tax=Candidatus Wallbacteria bacterium HGW-Wallbacteria-1 TaxID=2013854 RepID=A0A2N1PPF2_9BACT|nr:MAG: hypothetical protein CVV64_10845 [Candidatus Wallbacteria bacterium HGW-Wallbacteria-1]
MNPVNDTGKLKGFTLIELMIVIAIMGICSHILYSNQYLYSGIRQLEKRGKYAGEVIRAASIIDRLSLTGTILPEKEFKSKQSEPGAKEYRVETASGEVWHISQSLRGEVILSRSGKIFSRIAGSLNEIRMGSCVLLTLIPETGKNSSVRAKTFPAVFKISSNITGTVPEGRI